MTRQEAEKMIENHLLAIREIIMKFGSGRRKIFNMYVTDKSISGWMFEDQETHTFALNVDKFLKDGDEE